MVNEVIDMMNKIINEHDWELSEVKSVIKTGEKISDELKKFKWLRWTKFPDGFAYCRTDNDLCQMIDNINGWFKEITEAFSGVYDANKNV